MGSDILTGLPFAGNIESLSRKRHLCEDRESECWWRRFWKDGETLDRPWQEKSAVYTETSAEQLRFLKRWVLKLTLFHLARPDDYGLYSLLEVQTYWQRLSDKKKKKKKKYKYSNITKLQKLYNRENG